MINQNTVCIAAEYIYKEGKFHLPEESEGFVNWLLNNTQDRIYVINILNAFKITSTAKVFNPNSATEEEINLEDIDVIYTGLIGKSVLKYNVYNCLNYNLKYFIKFCEKISHYGIKCVNPVQTLFDNLSKEYLLFLKENSDLPIADLTKIDSIDEFIALPSNQNIIVKPLISERASGTIMLDSMSISEKKAYYTKWAIKRKDLLNQGIVYQKFNNDFITSGEKKIAVVSGKVLLSRKTVPPPAAKCGSIVSTSCGSTMVRYSPTQFEIDLCEKTYQVFNEFFPCNFIRVDLVGEGENIKINEIECINPDFTTFYKFHTAQEYDEFYNELYRSFI